MILIKPTIDCNLNCDYCYEKRTRRYANQIPIDMDAIKARIDELAAEMPQDLISIHGGEPLIIPIEILEEIMAYIYGIKGCCTITTNGTLLTQEHIELCKIYNTDLNISVDGPNPELSALRGGGWDKMTPKVLVETIGRSIELCKNNNIPVHIMVVLNNTNIMHYSKIIDWIVELHNNGIHHGRVNSERGHHGVDSILWAEFVKKLITLTLLDPTLKWQPAENLIRTFTNGQLMDCRWTPCDPYNTRAANVVLGDGTRTVCLAAQFKTPHFSIAPCSDERYRALKEADQYKGGCKDCKWWPACYGGAPCSTPDWRVRDPMCAGYKAVFEHLEKTFNALEIEFKIPHEIEYSTGPIHRTIIKKFPDGRESDSTVNGIRILETPEQIEVFYGGEE